MSGFFAPTVCLLVTGCLTLVAVGLGSVMDAAIFNVGCIFYCCYCEM